MLEIPALIERITSPDHPAYRCGLYLYDLNWDERRQLRNFVRLGLKELGLRLPAGYKGDWFMVASSIRAVIRFGRDNYCFGQLVILFHPDTEARKAAAAAQGWLFDPRTKQVIVELSGTA